MIWKSPTKRYEKKRKVGLLIEKTFSFGDILLEPEVFPQLHNNESILDHEL